MAIHDLHFGANNSPAVYIPDTCVALFPGLRTQLLYCKRQKLGVEAWE